MGSGRREAPDTEDLALLGAPEDVIAQAAEAEQDDVFWVLPECWDAVRLYLASQTQWRYAGMSGVRVGLEYAGVEVARRNLLLPRKAFAGLQIMELAILRHISETAKS